MEKRFWKRLCGMALTLLLLPAFGYPVMGADLKAEDKSRVLEKARSLQIPFIENRGQIDDASVKYYAKTFGGTVFISADGEIVYSLPKFESAGEAVGALLAGPVGAHGRAPVQKQKLENQGWALKENFVGASIADVRGEDPAPTIVSYFKGSDPAKWKTSLSTYNAVSLGEIYEGIELKLKAYGNNLEKLFHVKPGAQPGEY